MAVTPTKGDAEGRTLAIIPFLLIGPVQPAAGVTPTAIGITGSECRFPLLCKLIPDWSTLWGAPTIDSGIPTPGLVWVSRATHDGGGKRIGKRA